MRERSLAGNLLFGLLEFGLLALGVYLTQTDRVVLPYDLQDYAYVRILIVYAAIIALLNLIVRLIKGLYRRRNYARRRGSKNFIFGVENIRKLLIGMVTVFTIFSLLGIDFRTLFTSLSIIAAAIAIVSKDFVNDLVIGIYYSFTDVFEVGDYVKFHGRRGRVAEIGLLKVSVLNDNDDVVILPNSKIYADEIVNYTRRDVRLMSIDFELDPKLVGTVEALERGLIGALDPIEDDVELRTCLLKVIEVRKDVIEFKFQFRIKSSDRPTQRETKRRAARLVFSYLTSRHGPPASAGASAGNS